MINYGTYRRSAFETQSNVRRLQYMKGELICWIILKSTDGFDDEHILKS